MRSSKQGKAAFVCATLFPCNRYDGGVSKLRFFHSAERITFKPQASIIINKNLVYRTEKQTNSMNKEHLPAISYDLQAKNLTATKVELTIDTTSAVPASHVHLLRSRKSNAPADACSIAPLVR
jgi:hypothetical protein